MNFPPKEKIYQIWLVISECVAIHDKKTRRHTLETYSCSFAIFIVIWGCVIVVCQQDECALIWYSRKEEKKLWLSIVSRIVFGAKYCESLLNPDFVGYSCDGRLYMYCWS